MELSEFIAATLADIQRGVAAAIAATAEGRGVINPVFGGVNDVGPEHVQKVSFDVAVTATEKATKGGSAGIQVAIVKLGGEGSQAEESSRVSRVQFSIPVIPPVQTVLPASDAPPRRVPTIPTVAPQVSRAEPAGSLARVPAGRIEARPATTQQAP